jgi:pyruvate kinase
VPILALTPGAATRRRLALSWGVHSVIAEEIRHVDEISERAIEQVRRCELARPGDAIIITAGTPLGMSGNTNLLKVERLP